MLSFHRKIISTQESKCRITCGKFYHCKLTLSGISCLPLQLKSLENRVKICVRSYSKLLGLGALICFI